MSYGCRRAIFHKETSAFRRGLRACVSAGGAVAVVICLKFGVAAVAGALGGHAGPVAFGSAAEAAAAEAPAARCAIKGNISAAGERIYHMPGQAHYAATEIRVLSGERWFCSEENARRAGWRKAKV